MSLRYHEISHAYHRILNPFTEGQLMLLGDICSLNPEIRQLDLACGKGEMLSRWAEKFGIHGVGVDISTVFLNAARERADELDVLDKLTFIQEDAGKYPGITHDFDIVSCIGATWIGNGLKGTLELMKRSLKPGGLILVGEPYWIQSPPEEAYAVEGVGKNDYVSLEETLDRFETSGMNLIEMVMADRNGWDRYEAQQWMAVDDFLHANPADPDASALQEWIAGNKRAYLRYGRHYFGWGIFVLREREWKAPDKSA